MKKLTLTLLALLALTLGGCEDSRTPEQKQQAIDNVVASEITEVNYKGHKYLLYKHGYGKGGIGGLTHNPDCPCHKDNHVKLD